MKQVGKRGKEYSVWLSKVGRPYLDSRYSRNCAGCALPPPVNEETGEEMWHHAHHVEGRGSHHEKKMDKTNLVYLCGAYGNDCHGKTHRGELLKTRVDK